MICFMETPGEKKTISNTVVFTLTENTVFFIKNYEIESVSVVFIFLIKNKTKTNSIILSNKCFIYIVAIVPKCKSGILLQNFAIRP